MNTIVVRHSKKNILSYNMGHYFMEFINLVQSFMLFYFYEAEIGLDSWLVGLGLIIYALWDAVNDILFGYVFDRPNKFTKRWGRRFPWIVIAFVPMVFSFLLIFTPPKISAQEAPMEIFGWLVFSTCLFDTIETIFSVNFYSLFPYKFRTNEERLTSASFSVYISMIGIVFGFIIPPMIVVFGDIDSFILMAWLTVVLCLIPFPLLIPGVKEDREIIDHYLEKYDKEKKESLIVALKEVFSQQSFVIYIIFVLTYHVLNNTITASLAYYIRFILNEPADIMTLVSVMLMIGSLVAVPFWYRYSKKIQNYRKTIMLAACVMIVFGFLMSFIGNIFVFMGIAFGYGLGLGGFIAIMDPVLADTIDESIIRTKKRREGFFQSINFLDANLSRVISSVILAATHSYTGFIEGADVQPESALLGIHLHTGIIPSIILVIGVLIFWKFYPITPERSKEIKEKLLELGI
ncbi:MAG: MFS transporter [Promethearchaeota archaeon]